MDDPKAMTYLQKKIVAGGSGVWGEIVMPAHTDITDDETRQIILYIQSLVKRNTEKESLPPSGSILPAPSVGDRVMVITASYTDKGEGNGIPLTGTSSVALTDGRKEDK